MVISVVERATSNMLIGPDWAMNLEICDMLNRDPSQSKDVVKGIRRRIKSKNSKVQLLALTLLETVIKNCGDAVHIHVAEKDMLSEMVKIVKKKPDFHVKEKILILIDTWQEAFGGPRARYPQFYAAYQELLRMGAVFPQRSETSAPVFTAPQTQPLASYQQNIDRQQEAAESSADTDFPTLSLTEIQNARGIMDVLAEMLNAIDPGKKEGLRQEVIVDLVEQCLTYKQRVVHLINSTLDESVLCQGLALNDDLQRLLAKHEAIASGASVQSERPKSEPACALVDVSTPLIDTQDGKKLDQGSISNVGASAGTQLLLPAPPETNGQSAVLVMADPKMDLLSGDDFSLPIPEDCFALVPVGEQPSSPISHENTLALVDMFQQTSNYQSTYSTGQTYSSLPQLPQQQNFQVQNTPVRPNGSVPIMNSPGYRQSPVAEGPNPTFNSQIAEQQQIVTTYSAGQTYSSLPQLPQQHNFQVQNTPLRPNGSVPNMNSPGYRQSPVAEGPNLTFSSHIAEQQQIVQQQQQFSSAYGAQSSVSLPPPPWEAQPLENGQFANSQERQPLQDTPVVVTFSQPSLSGIHTQVSQPTGSGQTAGMYIQSSGHFSAISNQPLPFNQLPVVNPQPFQGGQFMGMTLPQQMPPSQMAYMYPQQVYNNQMAHGYGYGYGYGYGQQQTAQFLDQRMSGLSVKDDGLLKNSSLQVSSASYMPPGKPSKPEDKLFGDLVDIKAFKGNRNPSRAGS